MGLQNRVDTMPVTSPEPGRAQRASGASGLRTAWRRHTRLVPTYVPLFILTIFFAIPFYILFRNGLATHAQIVNVDRWLWLPLPLRFDNISRSLTSTSPPITNSLKNSAFISIWSVVGGLLIASLAGYGLARIPCRWRNGVLYLMLVTMMIPGAVTFIPTYVIVARLGWVNKMAGIIVPGLFSVFGTILFRQFYLDFPSEIEEAGFMDGLGYLGVYWYLVLPNSAAIIVSLGAITFIGNWNSLLWPLVVAPAKEMWTVQVALSTLITDQVIHLPELFAGAGVAIFPVLIVFLFLQRYLVAGYKLTGVTG